MAVLSVESVFYVPNGKHELVDAAKRKFAAVEGDHITLLKVFNAFKSMKGDKAWCREHFINARVMRTVAETRRQLLEVATRLGLPASHCQNDTAAGRKCLLAGVFANVAQLQGDGTYRVTSPPRGFWLPDRLPPAHRSSPCLVWQQTLRSGQVARIHPSSVLFSQKAPYVYGAIPGPCRRGMPLR